MHYAQSMGLPNGKTEAWYVLSAAPGAKVALGLKQRLTPQQLREAVDDGSISDLVVWQAVSADDVIFVPAGTIHAIGAGLVIAEIQQRSDATFRLFDHGRQRELHIESAIAVADAGPAHFQVRPNRLTDERTLLVSNSHFVFERIDLAPNSLGAWKRNERPGFSFLSGGAVAGSFDIAAGDAVFAQSDRVDIHAGTTGMVGLVAYTGGGPVPHLLRRLAQPGSTDATAASRGSGANLPHSSKGGLDRQPPGNNEMKPLQRVAFIGNHLPRRCGIATFTHDLHRAVSTARPDLETCVVAMTDPGRTYDYPPAVRFQIRDDAIGDYVQAAEFLNTAGFDVVSLQHEYGIFGGEAGGNIIELLSRLEMPIVTTLHTVLSQPTPVPARRDASDHRCFDEDRRHVGKRPRTPPFRS